MSKKGKSKLVFIEGNLNAQAYTQMLANYLLSFIESKHGGENDQAMFQRDNALAYSALHSKNWFFDNIAPVSDRPARSPDMNVIENAWT